MSDEVRRLFVYPERAKPVLPAGVALRRRDILLAQPKTQDELAALAPGGVAVFAVPDYGKSYEDSLTRHLRDNLLHRGRFRGAQIELIVLEKGKSKCVAACRADVDR